jgi:hypothetical protein
VKTENPSVCATVNWKLCKPEIALYCLYLSVIKRECVTKVLINPIIRTRTRHFVTRTTLHVTIFFVSCSINLVINPSVHLVTHSLVRNVIISSTSNCNLEFF